MISAREVVRRELPHHALSFLFGTRVDADRCPEPCTICTPLTKSISELLLLAPHSVCRLKTSLGGDRDVNCTT